MTYIDLLRAMTEIVTVSGNEQNIRRQLLALAGDQFDEIRTDNVRNLILIRRCGRENSRKIFLDAHMDQVGMIVRSVLDDGFLTVLPVGGIDRQILPGTDCTITGTKGSIPGVFSAIPPHLTEVLGKNTPEYQNMPIDTGYSKEELQELGIGIGAVVSFTHQWTELLNRRITGQGFDDKCCGAGLLSAIMDTPRDRLAGDIYVVLSSGEEIGGHGADCAAFAIEPDIAVVTDVNFAATPGMPPEESSPLGDGPMISLSAVTDRRFTAKVMDVAKAAGIPLHAVVEPTNTGTNANSLVYCRCGVPVVVVSIPLAGMHSYNECLSLDDGEAFVRLIQAIVTCPDIAEGYDEVTERGIHVCS